MSNIKKIEINDRELTMTYVDGQWWIAIKPICEALGVDYNRQFQNLKLDDILSDVFAKQTMRDTKNRRQEMVCLPEEFIYGWIFTLNSSSPDLKKYKKICYRALYEYFHGPLGQRARLLKEKTLCQIEADAIQKEIESSEAYQRLKILKSNISNKKKSLDGLDRKYVVTQLELWAIEKI